VHFTTTKHAKAKENKIRTWMKVLSEEDAPHYELAQYDDSSRLVGSRGEEPK
jgi:hypothetical protein